PYTDEEDTYYYEFPAQVQLRLAKEYYPEMMRFEVEKLEKTIGVVENQLANVTDNLYSGLYGTYRNKLLSQKSLEQAQKVLAREETRYNNGLITALDLEGARLEVETYEQAIVKADRDFENMHRQFNQMAGLKLDFRYDMIGTPFVATNRITISEDQAVADALKNRKEIWEINRQKQMVNMRLGIYQHKNVHLTDMQTREDYTDALTELEDLELQLSEQKRAIEKEIRKAWQDLQICYLDLEITKLELVKLKNQLETVENQYRAGLIPVSYVEQLQDGINQLETAVNMNMITTLIKKDQFSRAISIGPGY
ncbi:MAG: TolC family protein, partial [Thermoclostridium sp.]|nr:TolC family protein [Thermoclostridium sp.]